MSSCQGELPGKKFEVKVVDQDDRLHFEGKMTALRNGFFEIWLPKNKKFKVTIGFGDRTSTGYISTFDDSITCVTTFKLRRE